MGMKNKNTDQMVSLREQIQEDILGWTDVNRIDSASETELCQIVVDNFKRFEKEKKTPQTILRVTAKCSDMFFASLHEDGKQVGKSYNGYVPDFMPGEHYGDYVKLEIDLVTGQILNWKRPTIGQVEAAFGTITSK
jgi:hypothetical protein